MFDRKSRRTGRREDVRLRPMYQYWIWIIFSILFGAVFGWMVVVRDPWDLAGGLLRSLVVTGILWWLLFRKLDRSSRRTAEPYFHPVLGLWFGIPAAIAAYYSGSAPVRAVLIGFLLGSIWAALMVVSRWLRTRNDRPGTRRPVPTITGWKGGT